MYRPPKAPSNCSKDAKCTDAENDLTRTEFALDNAVEKCARDPQKKATPISKLLFR